ncbi:amidase family protein [Mycoplasmopsis alligatoris]|uniref:Putative aspartyl/glutamyl-tRNA amidotransferase subunit A n=1 Tax=Mycoplasmopsis alligatoris A21JP2 TaxID=747682 RepID=D4XV60_9BACT|nr:amidase family protein [Mycoplasmopsis alligatoris]EFF41778.1 putative aspartyl/glutamyl-tRNA amidotransferase subunit A [Mycoplasmopsis alligatoris A21JP2]
MIQKLINKGNYLLAYNELKNDKNNAVSWLNNQTFNESKNNNLALNNAIFTIKDVFATNFAKTQASSKILENFEPKYNATVVQKLLDAGAFAIAKVHNDELALGGTGTFSAYGLITNRLDSKRYAGGSSSGSIVTLSDNISFALGSDTGDSVRLPASFNGKVGFKPSYGAISRYGMFAYASSLDTVSYFAHNVNDIALISKSVYGIDKKDMTSIEVKIDNVTKLKPKKVIAFNLKNYLEDYVQQAYISVLEKLKKQNIEVTILEPNVELLRAIKPVYDIVSYSEASSNLANLAGIGFGAREKGNNWEEIMTNTRSKNFGMMVQRRLSLGSYYLYSENQKDVFLKAQKVRRLISEYYKSLHSQADLVLYPAAANIAPLFSDNTKHDFMDYILTGANLNGNPSLTIPMGKKENMPFSITLDSALYNDEKLLSYSLYLEEILGGKNE